MIAGGTAVYLLMIVLFIGAPSSILSFVAIALFAGSFGLAYPTFLGAFSASVGEDEQGWVMGVTTALFTLGAGITSLIGGELMGIDPALPFYVAIGSALLSLLLSGALWRGPDVRRVVVNKAA